jgi:hypothetical protein
MDLADIVRRARTGEAIAFAGDPGQPQSVREVPGVVADVREKSCLIHLDSRASVRAYGDPRLRNRACPGREA